MKSETKGDSLPEYIDWYLKSKGLTVIPIEKQNPEMPSFESDETGKQEQAQKAINSLTEELLQKLEKMDKPKVKRSRKKETPKDLPREEVKIEFSDISWYSKKFEDRKKDSKN